MQSPLTQVISVPNIKTITPSLIVLVSCVNRGRHRNKWKETVSLNKIIIPYTNTLT